ncbi:Rab-like protein 3 [Durusdinium trenchii]|uniref:Rab-like protein 3 n=2 Tax=Durusdinium trenchii TaxID=1381693 RepID=A0ABP0RZF5_9DINO
MPSPSRERILSDEEELNTIRILVAGDAAVGKTRVCELLCNGRGASELLLPLPGTDTQQDWTCGCKLSILREMVDADFRPLEVEVELWEVGGTKTYSCARPVFYDALDAVLLVYDMSNMKSYHGLVAWLFELCSLVRPPSLKYWDAGGGSGGQPDMDLELGDSRSSEQGILGGRCPVLFVANKCDLQDQQQRENFARNKPRPIPPERPPLVDRLLGGGTGDAFLQPYRRSTAEQQLLEKLCDFVQQGQHTEACCRDGQLHFDFLLWKDFVRRVHKAKQLDPKGGP